MEDFKVEPPPKDQAFVIYDDKKIDIEKIKNSIKDSGYEVKSIDEIG